MKHFLSHSRQVMSSLNNLMQCLYLFRLIYDFSLRPLCRLINLGWLALKQWQDKLVHEWLNPNFRAENYTLNQRVISLFYANILRFDFGRLLWGSLPFDRGWKGCEIIESHHPPSSSIISGLDQRGWIVEPTQTHTKCCIIQQSLTPTLCQKLMT